LPFRSQPQRVADHDVGVFGDALAEKRRLRQPPLPQPEVALAREQPVTQHDRIDPHGEMLAEVLIIGDEHLLDVLRMAHDGDLARPQANLEDVAVLAGAAREVAEPVVAELGQVAAKEARSGTGGYQFRVDHSGSLLKLARSLVAPYNT
jgi:hypothetical protein